MGTMTFRLPAGQAADATQALERACIVGGPDSMPTPTAVELDSAHLRLVRANDESGFLAAPWPVKGFGHLVLTSSTLMERDEPYSLLVELARGKVNQLRCQAADWQSGGLEMHDALAGRIRDCSRTLGHGLTCGDPAEADRLAQDALDLATEASAELVRLYSSQVFRIRHQRADQLDTALACRLDDSVLAGGEAVKLAFNRASVPLSWHTIERNETSYDWAATDALLDWAENNQLDAVAGPLIDFSSAQLPPWLWLWERDVPSMAAFMCRFVEAAVRRYRARIRRWNLVSASNSASLLGLSEEELMGLTYRLGEAARSVDPSLELVIGIAQPWGEYLIPAERPSPFSFADHLIRSGLSLGGLDLEVCMGVGGRGSWCRDPLDLSRLLDLYALLGVPLSVTLGYPASQRPDPLADPELVVGAGQWRSGFNPESQRDWAAAFASLALCKPYVQQVGWTHLSDAQPHQFPNSGLFGRDGAAQPALDVLRELRTRHLR